MRIEVKQIEVNEWLCCGCIIQESKHPELYGNYEVFKNNKEQTHVGRAIHFNVAVDLCRNNKCEDNYLKFEQ